MSTPMQSTERSRLKPRTTRAPRTRVMKAAVFAGPQQILTREVPLPEPGPETVRVRLQGCGVCASNLPVWEGKPWFTYPFEPGAPGHEGWGVIDAVGECVSSWEIGERAAFISSHAYAEYDLVPQSELIRLPSALDGFPFPAEPMACAVNVFKRSDIQPGQTVAIIGIGFLGALLTELAVRQGARVIAISRRAFALEIARRLGAKETIPMNDRWQVVERVNVLTGQQGCERVIEAVGKQEALDLGGDLTRIRGRLIIAGYHQDGLRQVNLQSWNWKGIDVINAHEREPQVYLQGMREAVDAVLQHRLNPLPLFTHSYPLEELARALQTHQERPEGFMKAWIRL